MGQKIIPKLFRLTTQKNWESSWIVPTPIYSKFFIFESNIRNYLQVYFIKKNLYFHDLKITINQNNINIYIYINIINKLTGSIDTIKLKTILQKFCDKLGLNYQININVINLNSQVFNQTVKLKKIANFIKKININPRNSKLFFNILTLISLTKSPKLFNLFVSQNIIKTVKHVFFLKQIVSQLNVLYKKQSNFIGYKIQWKGRLNGKERAKKIIFSEGRLPLNTIKHKIEYDTIDVVTPSGICSLKTWFFFK